MTTSEDKDISPERYADSIPSFCLAHNISVPFYYKLQKAGNGPRVMKVGSRTLITKEAGADWRKRMENESKKATA